MRPLILISALLWAGCSASSDPRPPPTDRFVFPSGIAYLPPAPGNEASKGSLYVASSNFDKCFDTGVVFALDLDALGLPEVGAPVGENGVLHLEDLKTTPQSVAQISSFAGQMDVWGGEQPRLFVVTRSESNSLHAIDIQGKTLSCAQPGGGNYCLPGISLTGPIAGGKDDLPRAPAPIGVSVAASQEGNKPEVWVTHAEAADSPARSSTAFQTYVVRVPGDELSLTSESFFPLGSNGLSVGGAHATAVGKRYVFISGRSYAAGLAGTVSASFLLRLLDRNNPTRILETGLRDVYQSLEARDLALNAAGTRLYLVTRFPDSLLVVDVADAEGDVPRLKVVDSVPLPDSASQVKVLSRKDVNGQPLGDLVVVTCSASSITSGVVAFYDADLGQLAAQVDGIGLQPYGLAVDQRRQGQKDSARLYVTTFGDGRVAVLDIPDLVNPQGARLVAHLGRPQGRDAKQGTSTCQQQ
ncbi:YncE family protein [Stigmatella aurantiaca]|uniref:Conserved uncharacterized protein n=1 Tax=Stigmatella aurantiaca (strain DW4/3-1) TaxID=378806 RepID=Q08QX0_STIAD|nr:hypothetical protein [Stigmatella aurantiaca]ADO72762.1 conserved uncharacterized protein [Stigmatella aurantiaca DW4/3-1]EAU62880.1 hypothetical protein STIAU_1146 [Stigmatella aurantiaca DW4/3-1]